MKLLKMFKNLIVTDNDSELTEMRSIVIMQRKAHRFSRMPHISRCSRCGA